MLQTPSIHLCLVLARLLYTRSITCFKHQAFICVLSLQVFIYKEYNMLQTPSIHLCLVLILSCVHMYLIHQKIKNILAFKFKN